MMVLHRRTIVSTSSAAGVYTGVLATVFASVNSPVTTGGEGSWIGSTFRATKFAHAAALIVVSAVSSGMGVTAWSTPTAQVSELVHCGVLPSVV